MSIGRSLLSKPNGGESSETIRGRVIKAREIQLERFSGDGVFSKSVM
jgi:predicted ATPase with chaperone activity